MRHFSAHLISGLFVLLFAANVSAYPLTLEQRQRLKQYMPRSFAKLEGREPVHVVALGDDIMGGYTPLPSAWESNNPLYSYPGVFLAQLAREFFYPGSVRLLNPAPNGTAKLTDYLGDEISLENFSTIPTSFLSSTVSTMPLAISRSTPTSARCRRWSMRQRGLAQTSFSSDPAS